MNSAKRKKKRHLIRLGVWHSGICTPEWNLVDSKRHDEAVFCRYRRLQLRTL